MTRSQGATYYEVMSSGQLFLLVASSISCLALFPRVFRSDKNSLALINSQKKQHTSFRLFCVRYAIGAIQGTGIPHAFYQFYLSNMSISHPIKTEAEFSFRVIAVRCDNLVA